MYSTETALLQYNEQLLKNIDRGLLDMSKAFDRGRMIFYY